MNPEQLQQLIAFQDLPAEELAWLAEHGREQAVERGEYYVREEDEEVCFYVVLDGELQVIRQANGKEMVLGTNPPGIMGGELALLNGTPSSISARAIVPSRLLTFSPQTFRQMFAHCPVFGTRIFQTAAERTQDWAAQLKQQEKLAALGKLSAGLAHELNNPSAAAGRSASSLRETLPELQRLTIGLHSLDLDGGTLDLLASFQEVALRQAADPPDLTPLERADAEEALTDWLEASPPEGLGVEEAWELAPALVSAGIQLDQLKGWMEAVPAGALPGVVRWLNETLRAAEMLAEIDMSVKRISGLVAAIKEYTYMDQAAFQQVDIHKGLDNTLTVLRHKLKSLSVHRDYDPALPPVWGRGGDLNQVWTNLLDNAADALGGSGDIWLITRCENDYVMVEIADNGPGIPEEAQARLFEPFFTTKEVGVGTGLGLDISYRIIHQHNGTIEVHSQPGKTRFIVRLPVRQQEEGSVISDR